MCNCGGLGDFVNCYPLPTVSCETIALGWELSALGYRRNGCVTVCADIASSVAAVEQHEASLSRLALAELTTMRRTLSSRRSHNCSLTAAVVASRDSYAWTLLDESVLFVCTSKTRGQVLSRKPRQQENRVFQRVLGAHMGRYPLCSSCVHALFCVGVTG